MIPLIREIFDTGIVKAASGKSVSLTDTSPLSYYEGIVIYDFIVKRKLYKTLEIGMMYGLSTLFICLAHKKLSKGKHIAIDPFERSKWGSVGLDNIKRAGLSSRLQFYEKESSDALPGLVKKKEQFNFIFVDGKHLFDYTLLEFFYADKLLKVGDYLMFHDVWMPSVRKVLSFIVNNRQYKIEHLGKFMQSNKWKHYFDGFKKVKMDRDKILKASLNYGVLRKTGEDDRKWDHFNPF